jgi:hypothetical protein
LLAGKAFAHRANVTASKSYNTQTDSPYTQTKGLPNISLAQYKFNSCFLLTIHRAQAAEKLRSSPVRGALGIRTHSAKS